MNATHTTAVLNICKRGDKLFLRKLLITNCDFNEIKDRKGRNPLHYCAETDNPMSDEVTSGGRLACARLLLDSKFQLQNQPDYEGFLPFHHSVIHGNIPLAKLLISHGADVNCLVSPLNYKKNSEGNETNAPSATISGRSGLHLAVIYANHEMLEFLLSGSFDDDQGTRHNFSVDVDIQDAQSATALHYAVQLPEGIAASMIKCILEKSSMNIDCSDAHGRTPLIWAATIGSALSTDILLELGADLRRAEESGLTALHCAASRNHSSTVLAIIEHLNKTGMQDEERSSVLDARDADNCTPLFYSTTMGHVSVTAKLLAAGADATASDNRGRGLFHCVSRAIASGNGINIMEMMRHHGANPTQVNAVGDTPLHEACAMGNKEFVNHLLQIDSVVREAVNARNSSNQTPLMIATLTALNANDRAHLSTIAVEICQKLVEVGANVTSEEDDKFSPLSLVHKCLKSTPTNRSALQLELIFSGRQKVEVVVEREEEANSTSTHQTSQIRRFADQQIQGAINTIERGENAEMSTSSNITDSTPPRTQSIELPSLAEISPRTTSDREPVNDPMVSMPSSSSSHRRRIESRKREATPSLVSSSSLCQKTVSSKIEEKPRRESSRKYLSTSSSIQRQPANSSSRQNAAVLSDTSRTPEAPLENARRSSQSQSSSSSIKTSSARSSSRHNASTLLSERSRPSSHYRRRSRDARSPLNSLSDSSTVDAASSSKSPSHRSSFQQIEATQLSESPRASSRYSSSSRDARNPIKSLSSSFSAGVASSAKNPSYRSSFQQNAAILLSETSGTSEATRRSSKKSDASQCTTARDSPILRTSLHSRDQEPPCVSSGTQTNKGSKLTSRSKPPCDASSVRSAPLRAQHFPVWTQTSFVSTKDSSSSPRSRQPRRPNHERINQLSKPRRRPNSCDYLRSEKSEYQKDSRGVYRSRVTGRQKIPVSTITPYLTPVARWPRAMASMLLMGEVSPLYCARTLNAVAGMQESGKRSGTGSREQHNNGKQTMPTRPRLPVRSKSALEARVQLSLAEKDFVRLAAQVMDQYDTMLTQRQKLARTRIATMGERS